MPGFGLHDVEADSVSRGGQPVPPEPAQSALISGCWICSLTAAQCHLRPAPPVQASLLDVPIRCYMLLHAVRGWQRSAVTPTQAVLLVSIYCHQPSPVLLSPGPPHAAPFILGCAHSCQHQKSALSSSCSQVLAQFRAWLLGLSLAAQFVLGLLVLGWLILHQSCLPAQLLLL
ncbi:hypothetical protein HaLaN_15175 [Haematococcus lacustris]|uniref:Uncharacterized protein n=1 Tax=Haematococcus lacustris TaxID=44745 RepID=A0A699ZAE2_HAELA|nr:hypothetical protein HaLaN_15175 [Haematococcus lacustris]